MRGKHISKSIEDLVREAKNLAKIGVKEIILIAQELTYYGLDLYKKRALSDLLDALCEVEGIEWIRLHYAYPSKFPLEVFDTMAKQPKVCNYLDIPLQHASDTVLERMKRQITQKEQRELIQYAKSKVKDITIRTTFLVGFPGETEEEFQELCNFVADMKFDRVGVFQYSHEEDTVAYLLEDNIPAEEKAERANRIMEIQQSISYDHNEAKIGNVFKVIIDRKESNFFIGRTEGDSPEVDNEVLIDAEKNFARIGDFATVLIDTAEEYDLYGHIVK
jgi:ribosomal protein S12 methylthiotransferase